MREEFRRIARLTVMAALIASVGGAMTRADDAISASTAPSESPSGPRAGTGAAAAMIDQVRFIQRMRQALSEMKLSDDQKKQVDPILTKADADAAALEPQIKDLQSQERLQKIVPFIQDLRAKLAGILTDDQKQELQTKLRSEAPGPLARIESAVQSLALSDDQKKQVQAAFDDARQTFATLAKRRAGGEDVSDDMQKVTEDLRAKLRGILNQQQLLQLREKMQAAGIGAGQAGAGGDGTTAPRLRRREFNDTPSPRPKPPDPPATMPNAKQANPVADHAPVAESPGSGDVGSEAPDFQLTKLDERIVQLSSFRGRLLVLEFGSWSCPSFRDRATAMEQLARTFGNRVQFFIVYTREAFPAGDSEVARNRTDHVEVDQPKSQADRIAQAKRARDTLNLRIPIAIDSMDDATSNAYQGFPNGAVLIGRDGTILAKQRWVDPWGLQKHIEEVLAAKPTTRPAP